MSLALGPDGGDRAKDLEILVLRHQLKVLKRKAGRPRLRPMDRLQLAAVARVLPKERWASLMVKPQTLLRWHRELVRRRWTYRAKRTGRPPIAPELQELICLWRETILGWGCVSALHLDFGRGPARGAGRLVPRVQALGRSRTSPA